MEICLDGLKYICTDFFYPYQSIPRQSNCVCSATPPLMAIFLLLNYCGGRRWICAIVTPVDCATLDKSCTLQSYSCHWHVPSPCPYDLNPTSYHDGKINGENITYSPCPPAPSLLCPTCFKSPWCGCGWFRFAMFDHMIIHLQRNRDCVVSSDSLSCCLRGCLSWCLGQQ